jgi:Uma2 family endonuclease
VIHVIAGTMESKVPLWELESERHPDLSVYETAPPKGKDVWSRWVPELVIEVVSPGSEQRDDVEKRQEYLAFGVKETWVVDADRQEMLALRRWRGKWRQTVVPRDQPYQTALLPGLILDPDRVLRAGE